jgi:hypothetical protein
MRPCWSQGPINLFTCRALADDKERLACYDKLAAEAASVFSSLASKLNALKTDAGKPDPLAGAPTPEKEIVWEFDDSKSPIDDSAQVIATLPSGDHKAVLLVRCREHKTEVIVGFNGTYLGVSGGPTIKVIYRIGDARPVETSWSRSTGGESVFASNPIGLAKALPDGGKLFVRVTDFSGAPHDASFDLGAVGEARSRVASACRWPDAAQEPAHKPAAAAKSPTATKRGASTVDQPR